MMRTGLMHRLLLVVAVLAVSLAAAPAWAQLETREAIALRDQIAELRHEVQTLRAQMGSRGGGSMLGQAAPPPPPPSGSTSDVTAQLLVRVQALEDQVRQLRGRVDELQNQLQQQTADLGKRIDDLTFLVENPKAAAAAAAAARKAAAEAAAAPLAHAAPPTPGPPSPTQGVLGTMPAGPSEANPPDTTALGATPLGAGSPPAGPPRARPPGTAPPRTPELAMQDGLAALARHNYPAAEAAAHEVLNGNRTSPRAYDAMFLLAQAQYGEHQYSQAALSYDDTYNRGHKAYHAEDALLGLANSLIGLNDKASACQALRKLRAEFPTSRTDLRERIATARQRADCR
jgi:TolA-binding protein